jgi:hypothetical protein
VKNLHDEYNKLSEHSPSEAEKLKMTRLMGLFLGLNKDEIRETDEYFIDDAILPDIEGDDLEQVFAPFISDEDVDILDQIIDPVPKPTVDVQRMVIAIAAKVIDEEGAISDALVEQHFKKLHLKFRSSARQKREDRINNVLRSEPIEYLKDVTNRIQELADRIPLLLKDSQFDSAKFQFQAKKTSKAITALQDALKRAFDE